MKRTILIVSLTVTCTLSVYSQPLQTGTSGQSSSKSSATTSLATRQIDIQSGTRLAAELQNTLDVRKAKIGDEVILKTTQALKSEGRTLVNKGARLLGHVTEVGQKTKASAESRIGIVFDRLETGSLEYPISATIISVTRGATGVRSGETGPSLESDSSIRSTSSTQSGGLIGGIENTIGGVVSNTTSTVGTVVGTSTGAVGSAVDATSRTVGGATGGTGRSLGRIQITESSSTSAQGGVVLSLRGENLRLEKGLTFNLLLNHSATAGTPN